MLDGLAVDEGKEMEAAEMTMYLDQYIYRKEMGLSYKEFMEEPIGIKNLNTLIMLLMKQREHKFTRKQRGG